MITRVSQLRIDPAKTDQAERFVNDELAPAVLARPGAIAGRWMVDESSGEVLAVVHWTDEEAMLSAGADLADVRDRVVYDLRATPMSLQIHEVIGVAASEPLSLGSTTWSHVVVLDGGGPDIRADAAAMFRIVADEHEDDGDCLGLVWTADFSAGTTLCLSTWRSIDALRRNEDRAALLWPEIVRALSVRIESQSFRRTVGSAPADHVVDLTGFNRAVHRTS